MLRSPEGSPTGSKQSCTHCWNSSAPPQPSNPNPPSCRPGDKGCGVRRVDGAEGAVILITAKATLAVGAACLMHDRHPGKKNLWRYNLSGDEQPPGLRQDHRARPPGRPAPHRPSRRRVPPTIERGLLEPFAQDTRRPPRAPRHAATCRTPAPSGTPRTWDRPGRDGPERPHDVSGLTTAELERARRSRPQPGAGPAGLDDRCADPGRISAIDAELARRHGASSSMSPAPRCPDPGGPGPRG